MIAADATLVDVVVAILDRDGPGKQRYADIQSHQEDWGWFIWFRQGSVRLAIDVHTDDADASQFRIRLTSSVKRMMVFDKAVDTPELDELRTLVESELKKWSATDVRVSVESD